MQQEPPALDYADREMPRPAKPPDGYLGFRDDEVGGRRFDWGLVAFWIASYVSLLLLLLWLVGRWLKAFG